MDLLFVPNQRKRDLLLITNHKCYNLFMDQTPSPQPMPEKLQGQSAESPTPPETMATAPTEAGSVAPQGAPAPMPVLPQIPDPVPDDAATQPIDTAAVQGPAIADDVDVIEKEWVDKAQEVIEHTKDDPYQEEEQIEDLQADYLKKRYGKDIKDNE